MALPPPRPTGRPRPRTLAPARGTDGPSDAALVAAAAAGDEDALTRIDARYRAALVRYCRTIVLDPHDAEDAAQAALAAALRALADGRAEPHALRAWLHRIAHREALAVLRRRPPAPAGEEALELLVDPRESPVAGRERLAELLDGLRALPERQRGALVLHEVAGLSFGEVGETLDISPAAARQAAYEARTVLRTRRDELQALFPAGPALAVLSATGGGAVVATGAATGGAGVLGAVGAWVTGTGVAAKCAAVCATLGVLGAGTYALEPREPAAPVVRPAETPRERPAAPARATADAAPQQARAVAPAATTPAARRAAADRRRAAVDARRAARERRAADRERRRAAAPAPAAPVPDVERVTVEDSADGGVISVEPQTPQTPPAAVPVETRGERGVADGPATVEPGGAEDVVSVVVEEVDG